MGFFEFFANNPATFVVKLFLQVASVLYLVYSAVVYKQTQMMIKTLRMGRNWIVVLVSFLQLIVAIFLILIAFLIV